MLRTVLTLVTPEKQQVLNKNLGWDGSTMLRVSSKFPLYTGCALSGLLEIRFLVSTAAVASDTIPL